MSPPHAQLDLRAHVDFQGRVAFQGAPGAFSYEACRAILPLGEPVAFKTFAQAFAAVGSGDCALGVIPLRNSTAGPVAEAVELLATCGLRMVSEHPWPVRLQLMVPPGVTLETVEVVASHPMALKQCARVLARLGAEFGVRVELAFDTAGAARDLARSGDPARAAIAARAAADLYGLDILMADIEDEPDNTTWFAVLAAPRPPMQPV